MSSHTDLRSAEPVLGGHRQGAGMIARVSIGAWCRELGKGGGSLHHRERLADFHVRCREQRDNSRGPLTRYRACEPARVLHEAEKAIPYPAFAMSNGARRSTPVRKSTDAPTQKASPRAAPRAFRRCAISSCCGAPTAKKQNRKRCICFDELEARLNGVGIVDETHGRIMCGEDRRARIAGEVPQPALRWRRSTRLDRGEQ